MNGRMTIVRCGTPLGGEAARIATERFTELAAREPPCPLPGRLEFLDDPGASGYALRIRGGDATVSAASTREHIAGLGALLALIRQGPPGAALPDARAAESPRFPTRLHYMPAHFGNSFMAAWPQEMRRYLEDMALAGASGYGDWFDPNDMADPYAPHTYCPLSMSLWRRKKEFLRTAKTLGLDTMLFVAHNVGFTDQLRPEWLGVRDHKLRVQGQVLCPSVPEARAACLANQGNLFRDLKESGVVIDKVAFGPYDDGGCACPKCQPYYPTFLGMIGEIMPRIREFFPSAAGDICGWWTSDEEMQMLKRFVAGPARDWFSGFQWSATYGVFEIPQGVREALGNLPLSVFFHIGFSNDNRDVYFRSGIHSAPERIASVIRSFDKVGCTGFHSYNESWGDHLNVFLSSRLARSPEADPGGLVREYVADVHGLRGADREAVARVLEEMQHLDGARASGWLGTLDGVSPRVHVPPRQGWAFEHVRLKAELMALDHRIEAGTDWKSPGSVEAMLPAIRRRIALTETLMREVYGLGVLTHAFIEDRMMPAWHESWLALQAVPKGRLVPGANLSRHA